MMGSGCVVPAGDRAVMRLVGVPARVIGGRLLRREP